MSRPVASPGKRYWKHALVAAAVLGLAVWTVPGMLRMLSSGASFSAERLRIAELQAAAKEKPAKSVTAEADAKADGAAAAEKAKAAAAAKAEAAKKAAEEAAAAEAKAAAEAAEAAASEEQTVADESSEVPDDEGTEVDVEIAEGEPSDADAAVEGVAEEEK